MGGSSCTVALHGARDGGGGGLQCDLCAGSCLCQIQVVLTLDGYLHAFASTEDLVPPSNLEAPALPRLPSFGAYTDSHGSQQPAGVEAEAESGSASPPADETKTSADGGDPMNVYSPSGVSVPPPPPPPPPRVERTAAVATTNREFNRHLSPAVVGDAEADVVAASKQTTDGPMYSIKLSRADIRYRPQEDYFAFELVETTTSLLIFSSSNQCVPHGCGRLWTSAH